MYIDAILFLLILVVLLQYLYTRKLRSKVINLHMLEIENPDMTILSRRICLENIELSADQIKHVVSWLKSRGAKVHEVVNDHTTLDIPFPIIPKEVTNKLYGIMEVDVTYTVDRNNKLVFWSDGSCILRIST